MSIQSVLATKESNFIVYQTLVDGSVKPLHGSAAAAGSAANIAIMDAACASLGIPWHLDFSYSVSADTVYAARIIGSGGVITSGSHALTGNFWAPPNVQIFSAAATGAITITHGEPRWASWFGAVGDGTNAGGGADNYQPLTNWIASNNAGTQNGTTLIAELFIGAGVYRYSQKLIIPTTLTSISGDMGGVIWLPDFINDDAVLISAPGYVSLQGIQISATTARQAGASGAGIKCISSNSSTTQFFVSMTDVIVTLQVGDGIYCQDPEAAYFRRVISSTNKGIGIHLFTSTSKGINNYYEDCRTIRNASYGVKIDGALQFCEFRHLASLQDYSATNGFAVYVNPSALWCSFIDCDIENQPAGSNNNSGIFLGGSGFHRVVDCLFNDFDVTAINIGSNSNTIDNPRIVSAGTTVNGILISSGTNNVIRMPANAATNPIVCSATLSPNYITYNGVLGIQEFVATWNASFSPDLTKGLNQKVTATSATTMSSPTIGGQLGDFTWYLIYTSSGGAFNLTLGTGFVGSPTGAVSGQSSVFEFRYISNSSKHVLIAQSAWF